MSKIYNLEERTLQFAIETRQVLSKLKVSRLMLSDIIQVIRSSGSIGANYIEANEKLGTKDFLYRIKICRKEAKETIYWLKIIRENFIDNESIKNLIVEAVELMNIFAAIYRKKSQ